ncbi:MAG: hypothetical protein ABIO95_05255 [Bdellovibrionota bacterium]
MLQFLGMGFRKFLITMLAVLGLAATPKLWAENESHTVAELVDAGNYDVALSHLDSQILSNPEAKTLVLSKAFVLLAANRPQEAYKLGAVLKFEGEFETQRQSLLLRALTEMITKHPSEAKRYQAEFKESLEYFSTESFLWVPLQDALSTAFRVVADKSFMKPYCAEKMSGKELFDFCADKKSRGHAR